MIAATLASKAAETAGEKGVEGVIAAGKAMVSKLRGIFGSEEDAGSKAMLELVETGNADAVEKLAGLVDLKLGDDAGGTLAQELQALVDQAKASGFEAPTAMTQIVNTTVIGDDNTTISGAQGSTININDK